MKYIRFFDQVRLADTSWMTVAMLSWILCFKNVINSASCTTGVAPQEEQVLSAASIAIIYFLYLYMSRNIKRLLLLQ